MGHECVWNIFNGCQATNDQSIIYTVYWQISDIKEHQRVIIVISWILRKESLNSDGQQFYQYQQNVQPPLNSLNIKKEKTMIYNVGNQCPGLGQTQNSVMICFIRHVALCICL
jgi:hypothetical protein